MGKEISFLAIFIILLSGISGLAQNREQETIKDLSEDWLYFDQNNNEYVPLIQPDDKEVSAIHFQLALPEYRNYQLYLGLPEQSSIWINQKLVYITQNKIVSWPVDSLINHWGSQNIFISIYKQDLIPSMIESMVVYQKSFSAEVNDFSIIDLVFRNTKNVYRDFFVLGLIIMLIIYSVIINLYSKNFRTFYDLSRTLSINIREEYTFKGRALNTTNAIIIIAHSLLISYLIMVVIGFGQDQMIIIDELNDALWQWSWLAVIVFFVFISKYWMVKILGSLFDLKELVNRHYLEYLRMSKIFFALLFVTLCIFYLGFEVDVSKNQQFFINFAITFLILRVFMLFFKFMRSSSFKNFYLFAYLCSTEFLPLVIGLKFILNI